MKDLYIENYNTLLKQVEKDTIKYKNIFCWWTGRINTCMDKKFLTKEPKTHDGKKKASLINGAGKIRSKLTITELDFSLFSCIKIKSKWIKDLNIRPQTINYKTKI